MKKAKFFKLTVAVLAASIAVSVSARELRSSGAAPAATPWGKAADAFVAKLAQLSGGELTLKHFHASQLGDEQTVIRQVARGRVDIGLFSNTATSLVVPEFGLLASPYTFSSIEQADCVADKHLLTAFGDSMDAAGVKPIGFIEVGQQIVMSRKLIKTPADLAGVKIRTAPTKTDTLYMQGAGGTAIPLGTVDSMPALKTGNVDAVTWPTVYGIAVGYHKEAPNVTVTNHVHQIGSALVSNKTWKSLSEQEQEWLQTAAQELNGLRKSVRGAETALLEKIATKEGGATVYYPNEEEKKAWQAVAPKVQANIISELGPKAEKTWAAIVAAKADCQ